MYPPGVDVEDPAALFTEDAPVLCASSHIEDYVRVDKLRCCDVGLSLLLTHAEAV